MPRSDISRYLIHFTRGATNNDAFLCLRKILDDQCLLGSNQMIRGGFNCVCFSEAPLEDLELGLVNPRYYSKYSPFGIMVAKDWVFSQGGRPVIYEPDAEYDQLPESHQWRHMRYEPGAEPPIDFTWREWRIRTDALPFDPSVAAVVVQDDSWAQALVDEHEWQNDSDIRSYSLIFDEDFARMMFDRPFRWKIITLK